MTDIHVILRVESVNTVPSSSQSPVVTLNVSQNVQTRENHILTIDHGYPSYLAFLH